MKIYRISSSPIGVLVHWFTQADTTYYKSSSSSIVGTVTVSDRADNLQQLRVLVNGIEADYDTAGSSKCLMGLFPISLCVNLYFLKIDIHLIIF